MGDVKTVAARGNARAAMYGTGVRAGGAAQGRGLGVVGIAFDWGTQADAIGRGARLTETERSRTRGMLVDAQKRVIASSDGKGQLVEQYDLKVSGPQGFYIQGDKLIAYARTPGYEAYKGLGWYGVLEIAHVPSTAARHVVGGKRR